MDGVIERLRESEDKVGTRFPAGFAAPGILGHEAKGAQWYRALGWGGMHSLLRLVLSFISIKFTAIYLGGALFLVPQFGARGVT